MRAFADLKQIMQTVGLGHVPGLNPYRVLFSALNIEMCMYLEREELQLISLDFSELFDG